MKRLNRDEEAVSPVIATILMVAITVVLAATLYMMVGDIGGDDVQTLTGSITHNDGTEFEVVSISPNPSYEDVEITVLMVDGANGTDIEGETLTQNQWSFLDDGEVQGGSRFDVSDLDSWGSDHSQEDIDEIVIQVDGVDGTISYEM